MTVDPFADLATNLCVVGGRLARRMRHLYADGELAFPEISVLARLHTSGPCSQSELSNHEKLLPQALVPTLASLERRGFIVRGRDARDRRKTTITLTAAGTAALASQAQSVTQSIGHALSNALAPDERAQLTAAMPLLARIADLL
ncbi:MarR family winged helix-turn-helix transcriptional regulator [Streptomyces sediminimaris]|uniref:MarR family winged helix-turn-helix transcriptional regulator n=1 Tax=Streptomyces sediminimaris TaxID=3383721 RepID=UPI00399AE0A0